MKLDEGLILLLLLLEVRCRTRRKIFMNMGERSMILFLMSIIRCVFRVLVCGDSPSLSLSFVVVVL